MPLQNDRLIKALLRQKVDKTPIWIMRQAGRYLPEYRETRKRAGDFLTLCKTPELACEVTMQPLARFDLDAAILFSDILTIPDAMGLGLYFTEGVGPQFKNPIRDLKAINNLPIPDPEAELSYVCDAVRVIKHELAQRLPLIGFSGSPWTLATYMVEGGPSKTFGIIKKMLYQEPEMLKQLLDKLAASVIQYLNAQIEAGANAVMIFDTWGGILTTEAYQEFSLAYMQKIISGLHKEYDGNVIPNVLFTKNGGLWLEQIAATGCHGVGLDWTINIGAARERIGDKVALQGNLDPNILHASPDVICQHAIKILKDFGPNHGHVFNLGHGITPDIPPEHVAALVECVKNYV